MNRRIMLIDLTESRCLVVDSGGDHGQECSFLTSSTKDNSVPGDKQTARFLSSVAAKPRVLQPNIRIVNLSSPLAGRVFAAWRHSLSFSQLGHIGEPKERWCVIGWPHTQNGDLCLCRALIDAWLYRIAHMSVRRRHGN